MSYYCCAIHQGIFSMRKSGSNIPIAEFPGGKTLYVAARYLAREKVQLLGDKEYPIKVPLVLGDLPRDKGVIVPHGNKKFRLYFLSAPYYPSLPPSLVEATYQQHVNSYYDHALPISKGTMLVHTICLGEENTFQDQKQKILEEQGWAPVCTVTRGQEYNQDYRVIMYLGERG